MEKESSMKNKLIKTRLWTLITKPPSRDPFSVLSVDEGSICIHVKNLMEMLGIENSQENRSMISQELSKICYKTGKSIVCRHFI